MDFSCSCYGFLRDNGYSKGQTGIWANDRYLYFDMFCRGSWYSIYYDYLNHKGYKSKQYSRGNVLMPGRFLTTTSDAFVSYVTAYDFIHQPEGCIDVDRPLVAGFERNGRWRTIIRYCCCIIFESK